MGLIDKIKDLFTDEEDIDVIDDNKDDEVKIKEIKKEEKPKEEETKQEENKLPTFMREKIEQEEKEKLKVNETNSDSSITSRVSSRSSHNLYTEDTVEIPKTEDNSFKFPVEFDDSDFVPSRTRKVASVNQFEEENISRPIEIKKEEPVKEKKVADLYKNSRKEEEHRFQATPIISPIYGVLDKNYSKDQIREVDENSYEIKRNASTKNLDFESVRRKAYGSLTDDIKDNLMCENCELLKEAKEEQKRKESEDNLVYDILKEDEMEEEKQDITLGDATENYFDYGVPYEAPKVPKRSELREEKETIEEKPEVKIVNSEEVKEEKKTKKKEVPPVKSSINLLSTLKKSMGEENGTPKEEINSEKKDLELTDDLFNLIDSMYDERND